MASLAVLLGASGGLLEPALAQLAPPVARLPGSNALLFVTVGLGSLAGLHLDRWAPGHRVGETYGIITGVLLVGTAIGQAVAARALAYVAPDALLFWAAVPAGAAALLVAPRDDVRLPADRPPQAGPGR